MVRDHIVPGFQAASISPTVSTSLNGTDTTSVIFSLGLVVIHASQMDRNGVNNGSLEVAPGHVNNG